MSTPQVEPRPHWNTGKNLQSLYLLLSTARWIPALGVCNGNGFTSAFSGIFANCEVISLSQETKTNDKYWRNVLMWKKVEKQVFLFIKFHKIRTQNVDQKDFCLSKHQHIFHNLFVLCAYMSVVRQLSVQTIWRKNVGCRWLDPSQRRYLMACEWDHLSPELLTF